MSKNTDGQNLSKQLFREHERTTNYYVCCVLFALAAFPLIGEVINLIDYSRPVALMNRYIQWPVTCVLVIIGIVCICADFRPPWVKFLLLLGISMACNALYFSFYFYTSFALCIPIFISTRYFERKLILHTACLTLLGFLIVCFTSFYTAQHYDVIQQIHSILVYDPWNRFVDIVCYIIVPISFCILFISAYSISISKSGRQLIKRQVDDTVKIAALDAELNMAANIQLSALPPRNFDLPDGRFAIRSNINPAKEVGGDFYDYFMPNDHTLVVLIADVSDKGVPAAMFMMSAKKALRCCVECSETLEEAIRLANRMICQDNENGMFLTLWMAILDTRTGVGRFINAGHLPPLVKHRDGTVEQLDNDPDLFIGTFSECNPAVNTLRLSEGDVLLLYTDGITDSMNADGESFGIDRLRGCVENATNTADEIRDCVVKSSSDFAGSTMQFDDMTVLALQCNRLDAPETVCTEDADAVIDRVNDILLKFGCPDTIRRNIDTVIDEIGCNIADHKPDEPAAFRADIRRNCIDMTFTFRGDEFNPIDCPVADVIDFSLARKLCSETSYEFIDGKNTLTATIIWNL